MSNIEWTDATWNPVIGCRHVAEGCRNCYAEKMSKRLAAMGQSDYAAVLDDKGRFNGKAVTRPDKLDEPLRWKKPRMIFVNSMSDLFHEDVPFEFIAAVYGVMAACPQHTFQVLTKRPERMLAFMEWLHRDVKHNLARGFDVSALGEAGKCLLEARMAADISYGAMEPVLVQTMLKHRHRWPWPLPNVWSGVSVAEQKDADKNIPLLLQVPSAVRFVSAEPLVGYVDIEPWLRTVQEHVDEHMHHEARDCDRCGGEGWREYNDTPEAWGEDCPSEVNHPVTCQECGGAGTARWYQRLVALANDKHALGWVIVGGESGPNARPCDVAWIRSIVEQCKAASVPVFVKQVGSKPRGHAQWEHEDNEGYGVDPELSPLEDRKGADPSEWPEDLHVREFPRQEVPRG